MTGPALVLVVDDDEGTREMLVLALEDEGYRVASARHGAEALERIAAEPPNLVLADMLMPVMDGGQLHAYLRERYPELPVVLLSADRRAEAEAGNAAGFLAKPFNLDDLSQAVARFISRPDR